MCPEPERRGAVSRKKGKEVRRTKMESEGKMKTKEIENKALKKLDSRQREGKDYRRGKEKENSELSRNTIR